MVFDEYFDDAFRTTRVIGVFRGLGVERTLAQCEAAWAAGVTAVEVTIGSLDDLPALEAAVAAGRARGLDVGAGTVTSPTLLNAARAAGASFTVAPGFDIDVVRASAKIGLPHLPGVASPSEVQAAVSRGLIWLKAFPVTLLGPTWAGHIRGPFPQVRLVGTGGVKPPVVAEYLAAGYDVLGMGSGFGDLGEAIARPPA